MIYKIVNEQIADLANCESEPIHIPGSIQYFGFLLAVDSNILNIEYCSANCADYIATAPKDLLNKGLNVLLAQDTIAHLQHYLLTEDAEMNVPFSLVLNGEAYHIHAHHNADLLVLEFEPKPAEEISANQLYGQMKRFAAGTEQAKSLRQLCQMVTEETRNITGFDRVMIYQFDKDYNGIVIAESKREDIEPFLNLYYPHSDIPAQARQLYLQSLVRLIADVQSTPVPLLTLNATADHTAVDLSKAVLRSVSPIHIEYLKNMGVGASFSISLVHEGKLWGLIACHHNKAKVLPHHTRLAAQLQGHFLTSQINVQAAKDTLERTQAASKNLHHLQKILLAEPDFIPKVYASEHLLQLVNASGALFVYDGQFYKQGLVPENVSALEHLVTWLANNNQAGHFQTNNLLEVYPEGADLGQSAAGIIYHSLGASELNCIIWFRPEVAKTVEWAGNPEKAMLEKENGLRLSPRKSFAVWQQIVRNQSADWADAEIAVASSFAYALQKQIHLESVRREEERYRKLSEKLTDANEELSKINWISTHDLKEPLRKIQIFGSRILESEKDSLSEMVSTSVLRMRVAAGRMQLLIDDILLYSRVNTKEEEEGVLSLNDVVNSVVKEQEEEIISSRLKLEVSKLPVINGVYTQLVQLFTNLFSNIIKFAKKGIDPEVVITCEKIVKPPLKEFAYSVSYYYYEIKIRDNGIGFDPVFADRIFDVFQRLHSASEYEGTGIGLAICRKIMLNHEGAITAEGVPNSGSVFKLYFPVPD